MIKCLDCVDESGFIITEPTIIHVSRVVTGTIMKSKNKDSKKTKDRDNNLLDFKGIYFEKALSDLLKGKPGSKPKSKRKSIKNNG